MAHEKAYPDKRDGIDRREKDWNGNAYSPFEQRILRLEKLMFGNGNEGLVTQVSNLQLLTKQSLEASKENSKILHDMRTWMIRGLAVILFAIITTLVYQAYLNGSFTPKEKITVIQQIPPKYMSP